MVYPAIAEHLVFKKGLTFTWLGTVGSFFRYEKEFNNLLVFTIVAGVTLAIANCIVKQHPNATYRKPQMDWDMFKDVPFLLMSASTYIRRFKIIIVMMIFDKALY